MLVFEERRKPEYPGKNLSEQGREPTTNSTHIDAGSGNRSQDTLVGGERSHHCANPAPQHISSNVYQHLKHNFSISPEFSHCHKTPFPHRNIGSYFGQKTQYTKQKNAAKQTYCLQCFPRSFVLLSSIVVRQLCLLHEVRAEILTSSTF